MSTLLPTLLLCSALAASPDASDYFAITVVDQETGRGVPLVELRTVNHLRLVTDSAGVAAFYEPGLMTQRVFFHIRSHGYEFAKDGFGYAGVRLQLKPGGATVLKIRRRNIAERLYRVTGGSIYRDTILIGRQPPIEAPLLNGQVFGSDSVVNAVYRGKIHWFWGDTNRPSYPLGNFHVPGATSLLPDDGGLDPDVGVNLEYFVGEDGFARPTAAMPGQGPTWIDGLVVVPDRHGDERLLAKYVKIEPPLTVYERGLIQFDDRRQAFADRMPIPLDAPLQPTGHPLRHTEAGTEYVYFGHPFPRVRVRATVEHLRDLARYEGFTCLQQGSRSTAPKLDRDNQGRLRYAWRRDTPPVIGKLREQLIREDKLSQDAGLIHLQDIETGKPVTAHGGSVYWNAFRRRWVAIILESPGTSLLGEIWYAEADTPLGPWVYARKIVTHDKYSFYNPKQHPMFDQEGGRTIFFEGTYTNMFSGNPDPTPRYNYNQVMYKLRLTDARLVLPVPVYRLQKPPSDRVATWSTGESLPVEQRRGEIPWFALDRPSRNSRPVFAEQAEGGGVVLRVGTRSIDEAGENRGHIVFHALAVDEPDPPQTAVPLYEFQDLQTGHRRYTTQVDAEASKDRPAGNAICLVWQSPVPEL